VFIQIQLFKQHLLMVLLDHGSINCLIVILNINKYNVQVFFFVWFISVVAISGDLNGNIYILDRGNNRVIKWTFNDLNGTIVAGGNETGNAANQLNTPNGIFIDVNTLFIWIADTGNSRIVRWESPSTGIIVCGSNGTSSDQFFKPFGLFVNTTDSNTFYVADTYNHRVQMCLPGATNETTVAGQTGVSGSALNLLHYPISIIGDTQPDCQWVFRYLELYFRCPSNVQIDRTEWHFPMGRPLGDGSFR
jgi:hypothetical protein